MDGQPYHVGCLLGLCIGADCPSHPENLSLLLDEADTKPLEEGQVEQMNFCFHLMLGKASPKMLEVYRFLAENAERIGHLKHTPFYDGDKCTTCTFPKDWGSIK